MDAIFCLKNINNGRWIVFVRKERRLRFGKIRVKD